jgi:maltose alpha-D-glucosyltransferase/alpha-amylase
VEEGANPDLELGEALMKAGYTGLAPILGHIEFRPRRRSIEPVTVAVLHANVPHQSSGWQLALDQVVNFFERVAASPGVDPATLLNGAGEYRLMGQCTAAMHSALALLRGPALVPEPMGRLYRRSLYQSMRNVVGQLVVRLRGEAEQFPEAMRPLAAELAGLQPEMFDRIQSLVQAAPEAPRIRAHGDYHLAQLMYTGASFVLTDFEGDPYRPLGERRAKRSPLSDVASLINSLAYVVGSVLYGLAGGRGRAQGVIRGEDLAVLQPAAWVWFRHAAEEYLRGYLEAVPPGLLPAGAEQRRALLDVLILEKMLSSVDGELDRRPEWAVLPLRGALRLLELPPALGLW